MPLRVLLADDHPGFREGIAAYLRRDARFEVIGTAEDGHQALTLARAERPAVVVLDLAMPGPGGVAITRQLTADVPETAVLLLSAYDDDDLVHDALQEGAAGYLSKSETLAAIAEAVHGVGRGETNWLSRHIAARLAGLSPESPRDEYALLSEREQEVAQRAAHGLSNDEIAEALFISVSTVKKHLNACFAKLGLASRAQLIAWLWRHRLVDEAGANRADPR